MAEPKAKIPSVGVIEQAVALIVAEVKKKLGDAILASLPEAEAEMAQQIVNRAIDAVLADVHNLNALLGPIKSEIVAAILAGKGKATSNPSALA